MPRIPTTPSPAKFVETWSTDFKDAVRRAAGKDGRLSASEATRLAARPDADKLFADTAVQYFADTGKKTVSVDVIAREMKAYAQRAAEQAAGPDKKLSLEDGKKLPNDLKDDFFFMRGKAVPATTPTPGGSAVEALRTQLSGLTEGLWMPSETDAAFRFVSGPKLDGAPITAATVREHLSAQHDALLPQVMWAPEESVPLATRTHVEERGAQQFLQRLIDNVDPEDEVSMENGQRMQALKDALEANQTDLKVFRFGEVNISTFIVGRASSGELVGLLTGQVET